MKDYTKLSTEEIKLIEENLEIVKIVILTQFNYDNNVIDLSFDDLYQVGCLAICEAAQKYNHTTKFNTFASIVIKNRLLTYCKKTNTTNSKYTYINGQQIEYSTANNHINTDFTVVKALDKAKTNSKGVTSKGITAILLKFKGFTGREIADMYGVKPNNVSAWISRVKKTLQKSQAL